MPLDTDGRWSAPGTFTVPDVHITSEDAAGIPLSVLDDRGLFVLHAVVLNNGRVLVFCGHVEIMHYPLRSFIFNPASPGTMLERPFPIIPGSGGVRADFFCCHYVQSADGSIVIVGGSDPEFGGHSGAHGSRGSKNIALFTPSPSGGSWRLAGPTASPSQLAEGRWYPTAVLLGDGRVLVVSGRREFGVTVPPANIAQTVEILTGPTWSSTALNTITLPIYPGLHLAPNGRVYFTYTHWGQETGSPASMPSIEIPPGSTTASWDTHTVRPLNSLREEGMSVLLPGGDILLIGGGLAVNAAGTPLVAPGGGGPNAFDHIDAASRPRSAEILETTVTPVGGSLPGRWIVAPGSPMAHGRINGHCVLLPDSTVLILGGHDNYKWNDIAGGTTPSLVSEIYVPPGATPPRPGRAAGAFHAVDDLTHPKMYHSIAVLLPDGRVFAAGGADANAFEPQLAWPIPDWPANLRYGAFQARNRKEFEFYEPPYFFDAAGNPSARPVIRDVRRGRGRVTRINYGDTFRIRTNQAATVNKVVLMRPGAPTHHTDTEQRYIELAISSQTADFVTTAAPTNRNLAPPGYYMLWIVEPVSGVQLPSREAVFIRLAEPPPARSRSRPARTSFEGRAEGRSLPLAGDPLPEHMRDVRGPGDASIRASGDHSVERGAHNWVHIGPRGAAGRIRALAIAPGNDVVYAGTADGGVWRTDNAGQSWFPLFHAEQSLSINALAIAPSAEAPDASRVLYAGTGEPRKRYGEGVFRSADGGRNWTRKALPERGTIRYMKHVDALAIHPEDANHVWVVGNAGVLRTLDGGDSWEPFEHGAAGPPVVQPTPYADVKFMRTAAGAWQLLLVRARSARGDILRIPDPTAAPAAIRAAFAAAANRATPFAADPDPRLANARLAVATDHPEVAYVVYAGEGKPPPPRDRFENPLLGMFRCDNLRVADFSTSVWTELTNDDWQVESQGDYNLVLEVSPTDHQKVFFGMVDLYYTSNGGTDWDRAMAWSAFSIDRAQHADHHALAFERGAGDRPIWAGHDGGISRCASYATAIDFFPDKSRLVGTRREEDSLSLDDLAAADADLIWERRDFGLSCSQAYDITNSPIVPTLYGAGFQDLGTWYSSGGPSWTYVLGGDGAFVAFDEHEPYRFLVNTQGAEDDPRGVNQKMVPATARTDWPTRHLDLSSFPRARRLTQGFLRADQGRFTPDTIADPRRAGHYFTTRKNRLYQTRDGERWGICAVGRGLDVVFEFSHGIAAAPGRGWVKLSVTGTAAPKVGLVVGTVQTLERAFTGAAGERRDYRVHVRGMLGGREPFRLAEDDTLVFVAEGRDPAGATITRTYDLVIRSGVNVGRPGGTVDDVNGVSVVELANALTTRIAAVEAAAPAPAGTSHHLAAHPAFGPHRQTVELFSVETGPDAEIELGGSALPALGLHPGVYHGDTDRPVSLTLLGPILDEDAGGAAVPVADGDNLTIRVGTGDAAHQAEIRFTSPAFLTPATAVNAGELAIALRAAFASASVEAAAAETTCRKGIRLHYTGATPGFTLAGSARARLVEGKPSEAAGAAPRTSVLLLPRMWGRYDLSMADPRLQVTIDPAAVTPTVVDIDLSVGPYANAARTRVTVEEVRRVIAAALAGHDIQVEVERDVFSGEPTSLAFSPADPDRIWVGAMDGSIYRSTDNGHTWEDRTDPRFVARPREIEAIAGHPTERNKIWIGFSAWPATADDRVLYRTSDNGESWQPTGGLLGQIRAIEIDPAAPDTMYIAQYWSGVARSTDGGASFSPFSRGLPDVPVTDLALVAATRTLRVATFGRGVYERHIGSRAARDVQVYLRGTAIDDGAARPAPEGPDVGSPEIRFATPAESPDIKASPFLPRFAGALDPLVDGVEFDDGIDHVPPSPGAGHVFIQVHNRGAFPATGARIIALWADASAGIPPLPATLWSTLADATPTVAAPWNLIGAAGLPRDLASAIPQIIRFDLTWPALVGTADRIAILALATAAEDTLAPAADVRLDVARLIETERKAALLVTPTRRPGDALRIGFESLIPDGFLGFGGNLRDPLGLPVLVPSPGQLFAYGSDAAARGAPTFALDTLVGDPELIIDYGISSDTLAVRLDDVADLAHATAHEVRRAVSRALREARSPARVVVGRAELMVRSSPTDAGERAPATGAQRVTRLEAFTMSDIVPGAATATATDFGLLNQYRRRRVSTTADEHYTVRVFNRGTLDCTGVRCRLRWLDPAAATPALTALGAEVTMDVPAGQDVLFDFVGHPAASPGAHVVVVATVDHADDPLPALPAAPASLLADLVDLCSRVTDNVAMRVLETAS